MKKNRVGKKRDGITVVGFRNIPQDRWDNIKWDNNPGPIVVSKKRQQTDTLSIRVDSFPADIQGTIDIQTGKRLSTRSQYERDLKEMGFEHLE